MGEHNIEHINIAQYIDHTLLKADATIEDIEVLCQEAMDNNFYSVCINSSFVGYAREVLKHSNVGIAACVGFPLGAMGGSAKTIEAMNSVRAGANEIDMVINIGHLKSGRLRYVGQEMKMIKQSVGEDIVLKVIFENCLLEEEEKKLACRLAIDAGVDFIKTSTGFTTGKKPAHGATREDIILMLDQVKGTEIKVKAAGGVSDYNTAIEYIKLGVSRIGTSSGVAILSGQAPQTGAY